MRITFVLPFASLAGGVRVVAAHAARLRARGHEVVVVSQPERRPSTVKALKTFLTTGRAPRRRPSAPYFEGLDIEHRVLERRRPVEDADVPDADVVVATWWETAFAVASLSPSKGAKAYFVQHHEVHDHQPRHLVEGSYRLPMRKIVISSWLRELMRERYGDDDVALVPNSVDMKQFDAPPRERRDPPTVGFMYSPKPFKGPEVIAAAIERLIGDVPDLRVVSFGARPLPEGHPGADRARHRRNPPQREICDVYAACDVWLCGSHTEGFGLPILEAMACRTPVASTRVGAAIDFIEDGVTGHVVDPGDPAALADAARAVLTLRPDRWRAMSDAAYARVRAHDWDAAAALMEAELTRLAAERAGTIRRRIA